MSYFFLTKTGFFFLLAIVFVLPILLGQHIQCFLEIVGVGEERKKEREKKISLPIERRNEGAREKNACFGVT